MKRQGPTVVLVTADGIEIWRGPLRRFVDDNDMGRTALRSIAAQLRRYANAVVGGGAVGDFRLDLEAVDRLARTFAATVRRDVGDEWPAMLSAHRASPDRLTGRTCVTHDYCDPNQSMLDAWAELFGSAPDLNADGTVIDAAWNAAKAADFYAGSVTAVTVPPMRCAHD